jgi:hypothetical protein
LHLGGSTISAVDIMHVLLQDADDSPTETATIAVVTQGTRRWEEQTGNTYDDNYTQGTTVAVVTHGTSRGEEQTGNTHDANYTQGATTEIVVNGNNYFKEETGDNLSDLTKYGM